MTIQDSSNNSWWCFVFESKGIQDYILRSNRLRDIAGASALVASLQGDLLDEAVKLVKNRFVNTDIQFSRRTGGAHYALSQNETAMRHFAMLWSAVVAMRAPMLEVVQSLASGATPLEAQDSAIRKLLVVRNQPIVELPLAAPWAANDARSGSVASGVSKLPDGPEEADPANAARRNMTNTIHLDRRFFGVENDQPKFKSPKRFESDGSKETDDLFPFCAGQKRTVALVHIDGAGIGQIIRDLRESFKGLPPEKFAGAWFEFSNGLETATQQATQSAVAAIATRSNTKLGDILPFRPIVLGGDDVTAIIRADLAFEFVETFIVKFEELTAKFLQKLAMERKVYLPPLLTADAGLVFVKYTFPFAIGHSLVERCCKLAKANVSKLSPRPSSLCMQRVTTSRAQPIDLEIDDMTVDFGGRKLIPLCCFALRAHPPNPGIADWGAFKQLATSVQSLASGARRDILSLSEVDPTDAKFRFERAIRVTGNPKELKETIGVQLSALLAQREPTHGPYLDAGSHLLNPWDALYTYSESQYES